MVFRLDSVRIDSVFWIDSVRIDSVRMESGWVQFGFSSDWFM